MFEQIISHVNVLPAGEAEVLANSDLAMAIVRSKSFSDSSMISLVDRMNNRPGYMGTVYQVPQGRALPALRILEIFNLKLTPEEETAVLTEINSHSDSHFVLLSQEMIEKARNGDVEVALDPGKGIFPADLQKAGKVVVGYSCPAVLEGAPSDDLSRIPSTGDVSVSPAGYFRIKIGDKYLFSVNKGREDGEGLRVVTPVGGGYGFINEHGRRIYEEAGIEMRANSANRPPLEMRQTFLAGKLSTFISLFNDGKGREILPLRELEEELVGPSSEEKLFNELPQDARRMGWLMGMNMMPQEIYDTLKAEIEAKARARGVNFPMELLETAYKLASENYKAIRDDGRVYAVHPLEIALYIVRQLGIIDPDVILAAITHDMPEDTAISLDILREKYGASVAEIVSDLTEDGSYRSDERRVYRSSEGVEFTGRLATKIEHIERVQKNGRTASLIIKVVDRLQNLLTDESPRSVKQRLMAILEIDSWEVMLNDVRVPAVLREEIVPLLQRARTMSLNFERSKLRQDDEEIVRGIIGDKLFVDAGDLYFKDDHFESVQVARLEEEGFVISGTRPSTGSFVKVHMKSYGLDEEEIAALRGLLPGAVDHKWIETYIYRVNAGNLRKSVAQGSEQQEIEKKYTVMAQVLEDRYLRAHGSPVRNVKLTLRELFGETVSAVDNWEAGMQQGLISGVPWQELDDLKGLLAGLSALLEAERLAKAQVVVKQSLGVPGLSPELAKLTLKELISWAEGGPQRAGLVEALRQVSDQAMDAAAASIKGGIDMNAASLDMQIRRDGNGVPLPISQQDFDNIQIDGLVPVIIDIKPASSVAALMQ